MLDCIPKKRIFLVLLLTTLVFICTFGPHSVTRKLNYVWKDGNKKSSEEPSVLHDNNPSQYRRQDPFQHQGQLETLGKVVQNRLRFLQNPTSCDTRETLQCWVHVCGLGCQINTAALCLMIGYALNRTVIFGRKLTSAIQSFKNTTCTSEDGKNRTVWGEDFAKFQVVEIKPVRDINYKPEFYPPAIPDDLADSIASLHRDPFLWWAGQMTSYIFKSTKATSEFLEQQEKRLGFSSPIVGVHIRRGADKLKRYEHAEYHSVEEYMVLVENWYDELEKSFPGVPRRLFLATDNSTVKAEINMKYPEYTVLNNDSYTQTAENRKERRTDYGKLGILHDIHMLSKCDYVVCTLSSNKMTVGLLKQIFQVLLLVGFVFLCTFERRSVNRLFNFVRKYGNKKSDGYKQKPSVPYDNHLYQYRRKDPFQHQRQLEKLGKLVQNRLHFLQNPASCATRRKLLCKVNGFCGFGCQVNTAGICLMLGYALNRTVVFSSALTSLIQPLSTTCTSGDGKNMTLWGKDIAGFQVVKIEKLGKVSDKYKPSIYPPAIPDDLADRVARLHRDPFLWWTGQITSYIFRPTKAASQFLEKEEARLRLSSPIVGVHVRRGADKLKPVEHAQYHAIEEYMVLVEKWYDELEKSFPGVHRRVFLATDDLSVKSEINMKYPKYTVLNNNNYTRSAGNLKERLTDYGKLGILHDIHMLSKCDYVVCTLSSNICRLTHQLMQTQRGNDTHSLVSVDIEWFFWGSNEPFDKRKGIVRAKMPLYGNPAIL